MTQINHQGFNQLSQSLHFRKRRYDANAGEAYDESFLNGDARGVQDGADYEFDGVDSQLQLIIADQGTLEVSAVKPDGTLDSDISISYDSGLGGYRIEKTVNESVGNIKVWTSTPTTDEKKAIEGVQNHLFAWYKGDEGEQSTAFDSSGNGRDADIANASLSTFHRASGNVYYSWRNNVGYTLSDGSSYYEDQAATTLIPQGVLIPRDESNPEKCTAFLSDGTQADLQYKGKVPYDVVPKGSNCGKFDGVGATVETSDGFDFLHQTGVFKIKGWLRVNNIPTNSINIIAINALGSENGFAYWVESAGNDIKFDLRGVQLYIFSNAVPDTNYHYFELVGDGTNVELYRDGSLLATKSLPSTLDQNPATRNVFWSDVAGNGNYFEGNMAGMEIIDPNNPANSEQYTLSEGNNDIAYGRLNGKHGTITNASLADFWSEKQDVFHANLEYGFDLWQNDTSGEYLRVPLQDDGTSIKGQNDSISGYTWQSKHLPASENVGHNYAETVFDTDADDPHFYDYKQATNSNGLHPDNNVSGDDRYYSRDLQNNEQDRYTNYLNDQAGKRKTKIENFTA